MANNTIVLTNMTQVDIPAQSIINFILHTADNPVASMPVGSWSVLTEAPVNGVWYT